MQWRSMRFDDLAPVHALADRIHRDHPEAITVFAERLSLFPRGCRVLARDGEICGYAISHPWHLDSAPKLDSLIWALPADPDCLYLHDIVIDPSQRRSGQFHAALAELVRLAEDLELDRIALVSVNRTTSLWAHHGFAATLGGRLEPQLASYGKDAVYMVRQLGADQQAGASKVSRMRRASSALR
jgi:hypothetical protein